MKKWISIYRNMVMQEHISKDVQQRIMCEIGTNSQRMEKSDSTTQRKPRLLTKKAFAVLVGVLVVLIAVPLSVSSFPQFAARIEDSTLEEYDFCLLAYADEPGELVIDLEKLRLSSVIIGKSGILLSELPNQANEESIYGVFSFDFSYSGVGIESVRFQIDGSSVSFFDITGSWDDDDVIAELDGKELLGGFLAAPNSQGFLCIEMSIDDVVQGSSAFEISTLRQRKIIAFKCLQELVKADLSASVIYENGEEKTFDFNLELNASDWKTLNPEIINVNEGV